MRQSRASAPLLASCPLCRAPQPPRPLLVSSLLLWLAVQPARGTFLWSPALLLSTSPLLSMAPLLPSASRLPLARPVHCLLRACFVIPHLHLLAPVDVPWPFFSSSRPGHIAMHPPGQPTAMFAGTASQCWIPPTPPTPTRWIPAPLALALSALGPAPLVGTVGSD
jgi:hypothetical protein